MYKIIIPHDERIQGKEFQHVIPIEGDSEKSDYRAIERYSFFAGVPQLQFELFPDAMLTDIIQTSQIDATGLLISSKVKNIFENHLIAGSRFYKAKIISKSTINEYWYFHLIINYHDCIDYSKTLFELVDPFNKLNTKRKTFGSLDSLIEFDKKNVFIKYSVLKYYFNSVPFLSSEIFRFGFIDSHFYISDSLAKDLLNSKVTGIVIEDCSKIFDISS